MDRLTDAQLLDHFLSRHDETAFAALVRRHGGLVVSACRRVSTEQADVEDAFQATFLVLLRKATSIRRRQTLACWLYRVANRVATEAQATRNRRQKLERRSASGAKVSKSDRLTESPDLSWREVCETLHAELDRLPENQRLPLILCYLDGKTRDEAARHLGWSVSTLRGRLERGRLRLRSRLAARGVELSATLLALAASTRTDAASPALIGAAAGLASGISPSAAVTALALTAMRVPLGLPTSLAGGFVVAIGLVVTFGAAGRGPTAPADKTTPKPQSVQAAPQSAENDSITYSGRVLGPDGNPVAGAKIYKTHWWGYHWQPFAGSESATTDAEGHFAFTAPKGRLEKSVIVSAAAPGVGVGWVMISRTDKRSDKRDENPTDLTLQLVADNVPITGQIVDLEGKPVAGATLRLLQVMASQKEDLNAWLDATKDTTAPTRNRAWALQQDYLERYTTAPLLSATTDSAGRFRLTGIGRERLAVLQLDGPTIASQYLYVITRPHPQFAVPHLEADPNYGHPRIDITYYGADFRVVAAPTKPIVGVIRDKDTKKPLAGITVRSEKLANNPLHGTHIVETKTDADGRYRLVGLPKGKDNIISLVVPDDLPYVSPSVRVPDSGGLNPVSVDVELKRAVFIEGRVTNKVTGKPIQGNVAYEVRGGNTNSKDYHDFWGGMSYLRATKEDGSYRVIGLPGPGQVLVFRETGYLLGAERDDEDGLHEESANPAGNFSAFARVDPAPGTAALKRDITLIPSGEFTGTILGPDGKPLAGAESIGLYGKREDVLRGAEFTVREFNPRRPRPVWFRHLEKNLVGAVEPPKEMGSHVTVRMAPGATVVGRVIDSDGQFKAGVELWLAFHPKGEPNRQEEGVGETIKTDRDGRFRFPALLPGYDYRFYVGDTLVRFGPELKSGETKDLGDIHYKR
jgi:RNA polymerase sigma factor (sigma-70 family)